MCQRAARLLEAHVNGSSDENQAESTETRHLTTRTALLARQ